MNTNPDETRDQIDVDDDVELSSADLESVAGGAGIDTDTSSSYDAGYAITTVVKQIYDFGRGVWAGIAD